MFFYRIIFNIYNKKNSLSTTKTLSLPINSFHIFSNTIYLHKLTNEHTTKDIRLKKGIIKHEWIKDNEKKNENLLMRHQSRKITCTRCMYLAQVISVRRVRYSPFPEQYFFNICINNVHRCNLILRERNTHD